MLLLVARCLPARIDTPYTHLTPCASQRAHDGFVCEHFSFARLQASQEFLSFCPVLETDILIEALSGSPRRLWDRTATQCAVCSQVKVVSKYLESH